MGWYYTYGQTRRQLIKELTANLEDESKRRWCLTHCVRGNVLWSVWKIERPTADDVVFIACDLLGKTDGAWGHKPLSEEMHPYYYTCPLKYLEMAPVACEEWRAKVREYHARRKRA